MPRGATRDFLPLASPEVAAAAEATMADQQFGRVITLPLPTTQGPTVENWGALLQGPEVDVVWGTWAKPTHATVILQTTSLPVATDAIAGIYVRVRVSLGGSAHFTRKFKLIPGAATTLRVFGRTIHVSAFAVDNGNPPAMQLAGALTEGDVNPLGEMITVWSDMQTCSLGGVRVGEGNLMRASGASHAGYLLGLTGSIETLPGGTNYFFQVFDLAPGSAIPSGAGGQFPLLEIGPLVAPGPVSLSWDRSLRPSIRFTNGLMWGVSNASGRYTNAGVFANVQADYGL